MQVVDTLPPDIVLKAKDFIFGVHWFYTDILAILMLTGVLFPLWALFPALLAVLALLAYSKTSKVMLAYQKAYWIVWNVVNVIAIFAFIIMMHFDFGEWIVIIPVLIYGLLFFETDKRAELAFYNSLGYDYTGPLHSWGSKWL